jgi:hypothetical protein
MTAQLNTILQLASLIGILAGLLFGILELRKSRRDRKEKAAIDVFLISINDEMMAAYDLITDLTINASPDHIRDSTDLRHATQLLVNMYEYWGILVFQRIVPLRTLDLLVGGAVRGHWKRLCKYIESERKMHGMPNLSEWFQWLAERLEQHPHPEKKTGAHVAFADWVP